MKARVKSLLADDSPFRPDPVLPPALGFTERGLRLTYEDFEETAHVRVTFEGLDSLRCSRGEFDPYETDDPRTVIGVVEPSSWLVERHAYLSLVHDHFVEVLARGLWFERAAQPRPPDAPLTPSHPALPLAPESRVETGEHDGIAFEVRANPTSAEQLISDGLLFSQPVFELAIDGEVRPSLRVRLRDGRAWISEPLGNEAVTFDHLPSLDDVMPHFRSWMSGVANRRHR